jgi:antitoxin MazE
MTAMLTEQPGGLLLPIPTEVATRAGLTGGTEVALTPADGRVTAERVPRRYTLAELLAQGKPEQLHGETDWGTAVGKERFWE